MRDISDDEFETLASGGRVLFDFYASWCVPCKPVTRLLEQVEADFPNTILVKVNIDKCPRAVKHCDVGAIPTLILFEDGKMVDQHLGPITEMTLREWLRV